MRDAWAVVERRSNGTSLPAGLGFVWGWGDVGDGERRWCEGLNVWKLGFGVSSDM